LRGGIPNKMDVIRQKHFGHPKMFGLVTLLIMVNLLCYVTICTRWFATEMDFFSIFLK